jgi:hypothetical protein
MVLPDLSQAINIPGPSNCTIQVIVNGSVSDIKFKLFYQFE